MILRREGPRNWTWIGRRWHFHLRVLDYTTGPAGVGFRVMFWEPRKGDWSTNVDLLTPLFDVQFGLHANREPHQI